MDFSWETVYKEIIEHLYDGVYITDRNRKILYWNHGAERITGYSSQDVVGLSCRDNLLNHVTRDGVPLCTGLCPLAETILDGQPREAAVYLHHANGHRVPVWVRTSPLRNEKEEIVGAIEIFTEHKRSVKFNNELEQLRQSIHRDPLTGLFNRPFTQAHLRGLAVEVEHRQGSFALLLANIDNFRNVNNTFGREVGDQILKMVATTLRQTLRDDDFVGRWGNDELLIIAHEVDELEKAYALGEKLRIMVENSRLDLHGDGSMTISISFGTTLYDPTQDETALFKKLESLLKKSKESGKNCVTVG